jgi:membrane-associated protein
VPFHVDLVELIKAVGLIGVAVIVFAESGLLVGIFLPGDSLLFNAGFLASRGFFNIWLLVLLCVAAAISGDAVGYMFGRRVGRRLYERPDSRFFKKRHLVAAEAFYEKHGGKTIVLARFLPVVRTLAPVVAGTSAMQYRRFFVYNAVGALIWGAGVTIGGYLLGSTIPNPDRYLLPIVGLIILISIAPTAIHLVISHRHDLGGMLRGRKSGTGAPIDTVDERLAGAGETSREVLHNDS